MDGPSSETSIDTQKLIRQLAKRDTELIEAKKRIRQLEESLDARAAETAALRRIAEATGHVVNPDDLLPLIAEVALESTGTDAAYVYLFNESRDYLVLRAATDKSLDASMFGALKVAVGEGITGWVARERKHVAIASEAWTDERFHFIKSLGEDRFQSILSVPLIWHGDVIGVVNVQTYAPHNYTKTQVQLLSSIASQVAGAIQASRRVRSAEKRASHLSTVADVSRAITGDLYLEEILQLAVAATSRIMSFRVVSLSLVDEEKGILVLKAVKSQSKEYQKRPNLPLTQGISGKVIASGQPHTVLNVQDEPDYVHSALAKQEGLTSVAMIPLKVREQVTGVLSCYTEKPHKFSASELDVLCTLGNQVAVAIHNANLMVKGALLQEMHHRVKNNLQQIASLLRLQRHHSAGRSSAEVLDESINRVMAVAAVHDLLSRDDLDTIAIRKIADSIVTATQQSLTSPTHRIDMSVEGPDLRLNSKHANSLALIINEMVQNSVEHGFKITQMGEIQVRITEEPEHWLLQVRNTGDALPEDFDWQKHHDLGLKIVDSLTRGDLGGVFSLYRKGDWTISEVRWPK
jgi:two-component sensor histidine kinase